MPRAGRDLPPRPQQPGSRVNDHQRKQAHQRTRRDPAPPPPPPPPPPPADAGRIVGTLMFPRPQGVGIGRSCDAWRSTLQPELIGGLLGSPPLKPPAMASAPPDRKS